MENEETNQTEREIEDLMYRGSLSIDEMLALAEQVSEWKPACIYRHQEKRYSNFKPYVTEFQGIVGGLNIYLESSSANSFSRWYQLVVQTPLNILGEYKEKESKCVPRLKNLYDGLESRYIKNYLERVRSDMQNGLEEARALIKE